MLHEGLLRHVVGDREIMSEQLDKLIKAAGTPGVVLQVQGLVSIADRGYFGLETVLVTDEGAEILTTLRDGAESLLTHSASGARSDTVCGDNQESSPLLSPGAISTFTFKCSVGRAH